MSEWDASEWEKPYIDKYKILVIDPERIVAVIPLTEEDICLAINAGIKDVAKGHIIKNITNVQEKIYQSGSHSVEVILMIEPKLVG